MNTLRLPVLQLAVAVLATALAGFGPWSARAATVLALGEGMALSYAAGKLDPISLEGAAEDVRFTVEGFPALTIARLRLVTTGALVDPDFTLTEFEAHGLYDADGQPLLLEATGLDVPFDILRTLARTLAEAGRPALAPILELLGRVRLGSLTLNGFDARDGPVVMKVGRVSFQGVENGLVKLIVLEDCALSDAAVPIESHLKWAQIEGLLLKKRTILAMFAEGMSVITDDFRLGVAALRYLATVRKVGDGPIYSPDTTLTISGVTVRPGRVPGPDVAAILAGFGEDGLQLQFAARGTMQPGETDFAIGTSMSLTAEAGDAINVAARIHAPFASWALADVVLPTGLDDAGLDSALAQLNTVRLVRGEIAVRAVRLADAAIEAQARSRNLEAAAVRKELADAAAAAAGTLSGGNGALREAVANLVLKSGTLRVLLNPPEPVPFSRLADHGGEGGAALWDSLNVSVTHDAP